MLPLIVYRYGDTWRAQIRGEKPRHFSDINRAWAAGQRMAAHRGIAAVLHEERMGQDTQIKKLSDVMKGISEAGTKTAGALADYGLALKVRTENLMGAMQSDMHDYDKALAELEATYGIDSNHPPADVGPSG